LLQVEVDQLEVASVKVRFEYSTKDCFQLERVSGKLELDLVVQKRVLPSSAKVCDFEAFY
jgi:hypothetical protein